jgi:hypothetical protein
MVLLSNELMKIKCAFAFVLVFCTASCRTAPFRVSPIADDVRKILPPHWTLSCTNRTILVESERYVWLLGPSMPPKQPGESDARYAQKNGYKAKYQVTLTFEDRWSDSKLATVRELRAPYEKAIELGIHDKTEASEAARALDAHPLPAFSTTDYSILVDSPHGLAGVYPPEVAAQADQFAASLKKLFHEYVK